MARRQALVYIRVSRGRMHRRNLEIANQRALCREFAGAQRYRIAEEFIEVEYSKGADALESRPGLQRCVDLARERRCPVLVADVDRLSRNVGALMRMVETGVTFIVVAVDSRPCPIVLGPLERRMARSRTKVDTGRASTEGAMDFAAVSALGRRVRSQDARVFAHSILPEIRKAQADGCATLSAIAAELNRKGIPTARNRLWTPAAIRRVFERVGVAR